MSVRMAVAAALIIGTGVFYLAYWFTMLKKDNKKSYIYMNEVAAKYYLFGLGALLSLNYAQAGVYQAVMIYLAMLSFFGIIVAALMSENIDDRKRSIAYIGYYSILFIWYLGIIIDFFVTYRNAWPTSRFKNTLIFFVLMISITCAFIIWAAGLTTERQGG